ncbi:MAG TPA: OsmC family protein [Rhizomicrobium sp.]|jgi:organic hydroperoxide reductase OsmC/OhrA|nr:OsmC family protein [Rhizomicrobium sp.]
MSEHRVRLAWSAGNGPFAYETYPRNHELFFKDDAEKLTVSAAAAYRGDRTKADPEDLLVAALSSCHMLSFLAICAHRKLGVESYEDDARGVLESDRGRSWITRVVLQPHVVFAPQTAPTSTELAEIHHLAHQACFIANSVKTDVRVEPR